MSWKSLDPRHAPWWRAALILLFAGSACARPGDPGVLMDKVAADLAFGAPSPRAAPPARALPPLPTFPPTEAPRDPGTPFVFPTPPSTVCPAAGPTEFPEREAPIRVEGQPESGAYRWVYDGVRLGSTNVPALVVGRREVTNVARDALGRVSFRTVEEDLRPGSGDTIVSDFIAQSDGVYLTRFTESGPAGSSSFSPLTPILYLPIPVQRGATFQSTGVDPLSVQAVAHTGRVIGRSRVDACGKVIEGWLVDAELTITRPGQAAERADYNYVVATHLGGLLIWEHVERPCAQVTEQGCQPPGTLRYNARMGQLHPEKAEAASQ